MLPKNMGYKMKKGAALLLAGIMVCSFTGCGDKEKRKTRRV